MSKAKERGQQEPELYAADEPNDEDKEFLPEEPLPYNLFLSFALIGRVSTSQKGYRQLASAMRTRKPDVLSELSKLIGRVLAGEELKTSHERELRDYLAAELKGGLLLVPKRPSGGRPKKGNLTAQAIITFIQEAIDRDEKLIAAYAAAKEQFGLSERQVRRIWAARSGQEPE